MVNLRYHVVSLIAVFLALAIGVVLGAGPLQNQISAASEGANLKQKANELERRLDQTNEVNDEYAAYVEANGKEILPGVLGDRAVVIVAFPGAEAEDVQSIADDLELAGAEVTGTVHLTSNWVSQGQREYRETLSTPVMTHLQSDENTGSSDAVLGRGLVEILTTTGAEANLLKEILSEGTTPLIEGGALPDKAADSVVLVGPGAPLPLVDEQEDAQSGEGYVVSEKAVLALGQALSAFPKGGVAVGAANEEADLIALLRQEAAPLSTVDQVGTAMAPVNAALALAASGVGAYGQGIGAHSAAAPVGN